ncbi:hypothetical protein E2N92_10145 [Methanofollis formosanus]|uniref:Uncharacterized protein n=1 Tax=Methanofollis formosanus TaxID=299308 RepID=A0A8G1A2Z3_9EURY|nr:hypothetical protein [Methanofollis formosanus]QYZ79763.1 hypothetical protein E2N92_10145 [Methanofollis formosanus]
MRRKNASSIWDENIISELDRFLTLILTNEERIEVERRAVPRLSSSWGVSPRREMVVKIQRLRAADQIDVPTHTTMLGALLPDPRDEDRTWKAEGRSF